MRSNLVWKLCIALLIASVILVACSPQTTAPATPPIVVTVQPEEIQPTSNLSSSPTEFDEKLQIALTPAPTERSNRRDVKAYHSILMLQRSADLTMSLIKRMHAGEISAGDLEAITIYNYAFILAVESFNNAHPPEAFSDVWSRANAIIQQHNTVYTWLIEGKTISKENLELLEESRQFLTIDQQLIEKYLTPHGFGNDFFEQEQKSVDQHFTEAYGVQGEPVPEILP